MKLSDTSLPSDPLITKAWNAMARSGTDMKLKKFGVKMAEILHRDCPPDTELTAAIILHISVPAAEAAKTFPPRVAQIMETLQSGDARYLHLNDPANAALPLAKEVKLALVASAIVDLKRHAADFESLEDQPELVRMAVAFAKAAGEDTSDFEDPKKYNRDILAGIHARIAPLLGTTGEEKLEQRYRNVYDNFVEQVGDPATAPPSATAAPEKKPEPPKGP